MGFVGNVSVRISWSMMTSWWLFTLLTTFSLATEYRYKFTFQPSDWEPLQSTECPSSCESLFGRLEEGPNGVGGKIQHVEMQERGEPKSGTGVMFEWATGALGHSCVYLQRAFGMQSCRIEWDANNRKFIFEPHLGLNGGVVPPCNCAGVDRVVVSLSKTWKHALPVAANCSYAHSHSIESHANATVCGTFGDAERSTNQQELWQCVLDANCTITDNRLQMAVMRDPRAVVVSSYYHLIRNASSKRVHRQFEGVDDYTLNYLPLVARWISVRYVLFTRIMRERSEVFWYHNMLEHPDVWHDRFMSFVGLHMPQSVMHDAEKTATAGGKVLDFPYKGIDEHPGGQAEPDDELTRTFRDELLPETLDKLDDLLRLWLDRDMLLEIGVSP